MNRKFLALIGSPRPKSTSSHPAQYLADGLAARDWQVQTAIACEAVRRPEKWPALESAFREADVVAIVAPLYVDGAPAELTVTMERLVRVRSGRTGMLFAVVNCGFAEASQNDVALEIYRLFARDAGFRWGGGLAIGGGGMLAGKPLAAHGGKARHVMAAFDQTIAAVDAGEDVPVSASIGIRRKAIPTWAYFAIANLGMLVGAARYGNLFKIGARPYARK